jgi:hypothetical protein
VSQPEARNDVCRAFVVTSLPSWTGRRDLERHFRKHGPRFPCPTIEDYEASALSTIRLGVQFTYEDPDTFLPRIGYYHQASNRLTVVTADGRYIVSHFRPSRGRRYCRELPASTYT